MKTKTKLHFNRYEFKYILGLNLRHEIEKELNYFMDVDPYVVQKDHHKYFVRSLYYDNQMFTHYNDKVDGLKTRSKFRLRTYTNGDDKKCAAFLEIKGRNNNLVVKHRTPLNISTNSMFNINKGIETTKLIQKFAEKSDVSNKFNYDLIRKRIEPVMLIDYYRRPYISKLDPEFRVTFDEQLEGRATGSLFPGDNGFKKSLMLGYTIMEVKFRYHVPAWFHRIIQSYELQRVSISKICKGIEAYNMSKYCE